MIYMIKFGDGWRQLPQLHPPTATLINSLYNSKHQKLESSVSAHHNAAAKPGQWWCVDFVDDRLVDEGHLRVVRSTSASDCYIYLRAEDRPLNLTDKVLLIRHRADSVPVHIQQLLTKVYATQLIHR